MKFDVIASLKGTFRFWIKILNCADIMISSSACPNYVFFSINSFIDDKAFFRFDHRYTEVVEQWNMEVTFSIFKILLRAPIFATQKHQKEWNKFIEFYGNCQIYNWQWKYKPQKIVLWCGPNANEKSFEHSIFYWPKICWYSNDCLKLWNKNNWNFD